MAKEFYSLRNKHLLFLDCEMTGRNSEEHAICSLAAIRVDSRSLEILTELDTLVRPFDGALYDDTAMRINRISREDLAKAPSEKDVLTLFLQGVKDCVFVGYNVSFDLQFIRVAAARNGLSLEDMPVHVIDVMSLCWPHVIEGNITSLSLASVCAYMKISNDNNHSAMADVIRTFKVYKKLIRRYTSGA